MEQTHADQLLVVIHALDRVPVQLELGHHGGWEVNPGGVQLGNSDGLIASLAQALEQSLLLGVSKRHRRIVVLQRDCRRIGRSGGAWPGTPLRLGLVVGGLRRLGRCFGIARLRRGGLPLGVQPLEDAQV
jgi:hypothetical protein